MNINQGRSIYLTLDNAVEIETVSSNRENSVGS